MAKIMTIKNRHCEILMSYSDKLEVTACMLMEADGTACMLFLGKLR